MMRVRAPAARAFGEGLLGQSEVGVAAGKAKLTNALFGPPLGDANGRFGG